MEYINVLKDAISNPYNTDFRALRFEYASSQAYKPYSRDEENSRLVEEHLDACEWDQVVLVCELLLKDNYLDIEAHSAAKTAHEKLGNTDKAEFHGCFATGLIKSLLDSGDGFNFETAFIVIDIREEFVLLDTLGLEAISQDLVMDFQNHQYDVFKVKHKETGKKGTIYFNVDRPKGWLDRNACNL